MGETNCCPSRGFASVRKNFSDSQENPDLVSLFLSREKIARYEQVNKRERERIQTSTSERAADCRFERASELYWERLDAVWPSMTTRLRRSPEHWPFGSLKGLYTPRSPIETLCMRPHFVSASPRVLIREFGSRWKHARTRCGQNRTIYINIKFYISIYAQQFELLASSPKLGGNCLPRLIC